MTQEEKRICAERLFDEIGLIDDRFIVEAASPYVRTQSHAVFKKLLLAAASLSLVLCVGLGVFVIGRLSQSKDADGFPEDDGFADAGDVENASMELSQRLSEKREQTEVLKVSEADIRLFGSSPSVIWRFADEDEYRLCHISSAESDKLQVLLQKDKGQMLSGTPTDGELEGLWISLGDGRVISPYLEQTDGNMGYGELFEYSPEYEPSEEFSDYLCDIIS